MRSLNLVSEIFEVQKGRGESYRKLVKDWSGIKFKAIISPHHSPRTLAFVRQIQSDQKVSYQKSLWSSLVFNNLVEFNSELPEALRQISLLSLWDLEIRSLLADFLIQQKNQAMAPVPEWASMQVGPYRGAQSKRIALFPGSVWATKQWTFAGFSQVTGRLLAEGWQVSFLGGPEEIVIGEALRELHPQAENLMGKYSLAESLDFLRDCRFVLANDSAGQHLAAVAGVPSLTIFGPTVLAQGFRPWNPAAHIVQNSEVQCRPCGPHGHKICPLGTHSCMRGISSDEVFNSLRNLIGRPSP